MYSEKFEKAFDYLMLLEGGYVNHPNDPGGETKYGISKRAYPSLDIKRLTLAEAKKIYFCDYWLKPRCDDIKNDVVSAKLFDISVNFGDKPAIRLLQRSLCAGGINTHEDGVWGPQTRLNSEKILPEVLLAALKAETAGQYRLIVAKNPKQEIFLSGWLRRAYSDINTVL